MERHILIHIAEGAFNQSYAATTTSSATEAETHADTTTAAFASLGTFGDVVKKDYEMKHVGTDVTATAELTENGAVQVTVTDQNGNVLDVYTIDPKNGTGTNRAAETVNLPQTGTTSRSTAAAVGGALAMIAAGFWTAIRSLRKKKDE